MGVVREGNREYLGWMKDGCVREGNRECLGWMKDGCVGREIENVWVE